MASGHPPEGDRATHHPAIMLVGQFRGTQRFLSDPYFSALLRGVEREIASRGVDLIVR
jgi:DNA-binding LacI/PurR family transcriptional regulator